MTATVRQKTPPSFCVACDAAEGKCAHGGARYHESWFEYQTAPGSGKIDPQYRDWFDSNPHGHEGRSEPKPRSFQSILDGLTLHMWLDDGAREGLEEAYRKSPLQTSYLTAEVVRSCESGQIRSPLGLLKKRLREV